MKESGEALRKLLRRRAKAFSEYHLPKWEEIPDEGLYMEKTLEVVDGFLNYFPSRTARPELITASTINNYVQRELVPEPIRKRYYRRHIAYLLIICTLKYGVGLSGIERLLAADLSDEELRQFYEAYSVCLSETTSNLKKLVLTVAKPLDESTSGVMEDGAESDDEADDGPNLHNLIIACAAISSVTSLFADGLLELDGEEPESTKKKVRKSLMSKGRDVK